MTYFTMENEELLNGSMVYNEVFDVDGLIMKFSGDAIELSPQSVSSGHPRYTFYKNVARAEEVQRKRRAEFLERQKECVFIIFKHQNINVKEIRNSKIAYFIKKQVMGILQI